MVNVRKIIQTKKSRLPQMEYMWRCVLPLLDWDKTQIEKRTSEHFNKTLDFLSEGMSRSLENLDDSGWDGLENPGPAPKHKPKADTLNYIEELSNRVTSVDMPFPSIETNKHTTANRFVTTASNESTPNLTIKIDEMEDGGTLNYLTRWMGMVSRSDGFHNPPAMYKRDIRVIRMSKSMEDTHVSIYHGAYPVDVSPVSYTYDGNGILQYSVTFAGDRISHEIKKVEMPKGTGALNPVEWWKYYRDNTTQRAERNL